jgi:hypothetical protein
MPPGDAGGAMRVINIPEAGGFFSAGYARKWLAIVPQRPRVRFLEYSRAWCVEAIRQELVQLARRRNCRLWYSGDAATGVPDEVPRGVRLAWLMAGHDDLPPRADLAFRVRRLRGRPSRRVGLPLSCPVENGVTGHRPDGAGCGPCGR